MGQTASNQMVTEREDAAKRDDGITWWFRLLVRSVSVIAGFIAMALGIFVCVTFHPICIAAGIIQILVGGIVLILEAPCCCQFLEFIQPLSRFSDRLPYWGKAVSYVLLGLPAFIVCSEVTTFFAGFFIIIAGVLYGVMAVGKKGSRQDMLTQARQDSGNMNDNLVRQEASPSEYAMPPLSGDVAKMAATSYSSFPSNTGQ